MSDLSQITGGTVRYMERKKTGDYEHREICVEVNFSAGEGQNDTAVLDHAAEEAMRKAKELLAGDLKRAVGRPPRVAKNVEATKANTDPALDEARKILGTTATEPAGNADPFAAGAADMKSVPSAGSDTAQPQDTNTTTQTAGASADPFAETTGSVSSENSSKKSSVEETPTSSQPQETSLPEAANDEWTAETAPITDKQLLDACAKKNAEIMFPPAIRNLVAVFVSAGQHVQDIPAARRKEFLDRLDKLVKPAMVA